MHQRHRDAMQYVFDKRKIKSRGKNEKGNDNYRVTLAAVSDMLDCYHVLTKKPTMQLLQKLMSHLDKVGWPSPSIKTKAEKMLETYGKEQEKYTD